MDCSDSAQGVTLSLACPAWASAAPETASTSQNGRKAYAAICRHAEQEWRNGPFTGFCECLDVLMRHVSQVLSNTGFSAPQFRQDAFLVLCPFLLGPQVWQQVTCVTWTWQAMFLNFALRCVKFGRTQVGSQVLTQTLSPNCQKDSTVQYHFYLSRSVTLAKHWAFQPYCRWPSPTRPVGSSHPSTPPYWSTCIQNFLTETAGPLRNIFARIPFEAKTKICSKCDFTIFHYYTISIISTTYLYTYMYIIQWELALGLFVQSIGVAHTSMISLSMKNHWKTTCRSYVDAIVMTKTGAPHFLLASKSPMEYSNSA